MIAMHTMAQKKTPNQHSRITESACLSDASTSTLRLWEQHELIKPVWIEVPANNPFIVMPSENMDMAMTAVCLQHC